MQFSAGVWSNYSSFYLPSSFMLKTLSLFLFWNFLQITWQLGLAKKGWEESLGVCLLLQFCLGFWDSQSLFLMVRNSAWRWFLDEGIIPLLKKMGLNACIDRAFTSAYRIAFFCSIPESDSQWGCWCSLKKQGLICPY